MPTDGASARCGARCPRSSGARSAGDALAGAATGHRVGALGTPAWCCGGRVGALPNDAARRGSASATGCRRGGATKLQLTGVGCCRSRRPVSCSDAWWAIWREPGAPDADRGEVAVVAEDVTVQLKPRKILLRRHLRVQVKGVVARRPSRNLRAPGEVVSVHGALLLHRRGDC